MNTKVFGTLHIVQDDFSVDEIVIDANMEFIDATNLLKMLKTCWWCWRPRGWTLKLKVDDMARGIWALDDKWGHDSLGKPWHDKEEININDIAWLGFGTSNGKMTHPVVICGLYHLKESLKPLHEPTHLAGSWWWCMILLVEHVDIPCRHWVVWKS